jgi:Mn-dependent DtxR family transcriptional regulator
VSENEICLLPRVEVCKQCNEPFVLSSEERLWYLSKKLKEPRRCPDCRKYNREHKEAAASNPQRGGDGNG